MQKPSLKMAPVNESGEDKDEDLEVGKKEEEEEEAVSLLLLSFIVDLWRSKNDLLWRKSFF